ncbi:MAG TPA: hypothetical protein VNQ79_18290 [Blastocatellia bacterium]|nr:hypothetical protein [Blastocatellia bacterium]
MKVKTLLLAGLLLGLISALVAWRSRHNAEAARVTAVTLERLGLDASAVLNAVPQGADLSHFAHTMTQIRTLKDEKGVERYHLTRQRLVRGDGSFIEQLTYNDGRIVTAWSSADGKYLEYQQGASVIRQFGEAARPPDGAQRFEQARRKNLPFLWDQGLLSYLDTSQPNEPKKRVDAVYACQLSLPLRVAWPNGHTSTVSLIRGEPDQAEWERIRAAIPEGLPVAAGDN